MIKRATTILVMATAMATAALGFGGIASAQDNAAGADQQKAQQLMQQYRQKAGQLQQIHKETIEANPQLAAQQEQFEKQVRQAVENEGYDVDKGQERIQEMAQQLQTDELDESERQAVMKDFRAERQQMAQAREAALQKPEIQSAGQELQSNTLAAMKEQDGQTDQLLQDMESLRSQLRSAMPAPAQSPGSG